MRLADFDFDLPEELIATRPARPRPSARLLVAEGDRITDAWVYDLGRWLRPGDRLVLNDTKVIPARLFGTRERGGPAGPTQARIEVTLLDPAPEGGESDTRSETGRKGEAVVRSERRGRNQRSRSELRKRSARVSGRRQFR